MRALATAQNLPAESFGQRAWLDAASRWLTHRTSTRPSVVFGHERTQNKDETVRGLRVKDHFEKNALASAIRFAIATGCAASLAAAPVFAQEEDEDEVELERMEITGSRLSRADIEGALPVTVIERQDIELSGQTSVADLLRDVSFASGGSFRPQSGSSAQSFAGLNLRALGEGRTLILIDGRRAPTAPNLGEGQDLNTIPLAAVERIEILSDGASAIYGSDAIGGVVNIITRKDFTGVELKYGRGFPENEGGDTEEASALFGLATDRAHIVVGASYNSRDIIFARDREFSRGGASIFSNNFLTTGLSFLDNPTFGAANEPGCQGPGFSVSDGLCFYDFTLVSADEAEIENSSLFARATYDISDDWEAYMNASVSRVESFGRYAPVPSSPWLVGGFGFPVLEPGTPNHPATSPDQGGLNPNWEAYQDVADDVVLFTHRFAANGPRDTTTDANVYDIDLGVRGLLFDRVRVEGGIRRTDSQYYEIGRNYIVSALAQPQFDSGAYNIYDPLNTPDDVLESFTATIGRDAQLLAEEVYGTATADTFVLPAGPVGVAVGFQYRDESYKDIYDDLQQAGNITGSAGNSAEGERDQRSVFGEVLVPILPNLEVTGALRWDNYSDFDAETTGKISVRWQPLDMLTLRGSFGTGFRAPPLSIISARPSFSADSVVDEQTAIALGVDPGESIQITSFAISNPDLAAETSDQFSLGIAIQPFDWINGSLDYFNIEVEDRVAGIGSQTVINCLLGTQTNCPPGLAELDPNAQVPDESLGLGVARNPETGQIVYVQDGFASLGTIETSGFDVNIRTNFDLGRFGGFRNNFQATYLDEYIVDSGDNVAGEVDLPQLRWNLQNIYSISDFSFALNVNYIDEQEPAASPEQDKVDSWTTFDFQANYFTPWNSQITVGADNFTDEDPPLDPGQARGFDFDLYDAYGRVLYARYTQNF